MEQKFLQAIKWIVAIFDENKISYRIGGGAAVHLYGSSRPVKDIDIALSGKYFSVIIPLVRDHIIAGPQHYLNEKWDCTTLSLNYHGQDIDLTDVDTLLMRSKDGTEWIRNKEIYDKYPDVVKEVEGLKVTLMHPQALLGYKEHLNGEHQRADQRFLEEYLE